MVCDITVQRLLRLENAMAQCQASMPPMRGCLQTSMILEVGALWKYNGSMLGARNKHGRQDLMLSTTDHTRFLKVIKSKVQGTINVVSALSPIKSKLELFVMLSSSCSPHHALLIVGNHWQPRSGQLCGRQHLPRCLCGSTGYPGLSTRPPLSVWTACSGQG